MPKGEQDEFANKFLAAAAIGDYMSKNHELGEREGNAFGVQIIMALEDKGFKIIRDRRRD